MNSCQVCKENSFKYTCPKCLIKSCSLQCVNVHKGNSGCNGKRERTTFVPLLEFDENQLISDYYFLEEAMRENDSAKRFLSQTSPSFHIPSSPVMFHLKREAKNRKIELKFFPSGMSRRDSNTSVYDKIFRCIFWKIEWVFEDYNNQIFFDLRVDENSSPKNALNRFLNSQIEKSNDEAKSQSQSVDSIVNSNEKSIDQTKSQSQNFDILFNSNEKSKLRFRILKLPCQANEPDFFELDGDQCLKSQLGGLTVYEHPTIHVSSPETLKKLPLRIDLTKPRLLKKPKS